MSSQTHVVIEEGNERADGSGQMFDAIASRYDLLNGLMSFGMDRGWRKKAVSALGVSGAVRILDLACGTADLSIEIARSIPQAEVVGIDPSEGMLAVGTTKLERLSLSSRVSLRPGIAEALPFEDDSMDGATVAFGIRNVPDRAKGLAELCRVLRPKAHLVVLELSEPPSGLMGAMAKLHMKALVPAMGAVLSMPVAYRYLPSSIAAFPAPEVFCQHMTDAGFQNVSSERLWPGVCHLYVGEAT